MAKSTGQYRPHDVRDILTLKLGVQFSTLFAVNKGLTFGYRWKHEVCDEVESRLVHVHICGTFEEWDEDHL